MSFTDYGKNQVRISIPMEIKWTYNLNLDASPKTYVHVLQMMPSTEPELQG